MSEEMRMDEETGKNKEGKNTIKLTCGYCKYTWNYKGKKKVLATCPDCVHKVKIPR